ncbi:MAG: hypothetical protein WC637_02390, partial [Victivallales bacterium]
DSNAAELVISYKNASNWTIMKSIPFTDLPDDIRKEFKYDPAMGAAYEKGRQAWERKNAEEKAEADKQKKIDDQFFEQNVKKMLQDEQKEASEREKAALEKKNNPGAAKEDDLAKYANQLAGSTLTDMQKSQLLKELRFKELQSSGAVKEVRRMDDSDMTLVPGEADVVITHTQSNAWTVRIYNPNYPKSIAVFIVVYNFDIAKNLSKGDQIKFKGTFSGFSNNRIYLNPSTMLK